MLPTPPHDDAVSVSYRPENAYLKRTLTSLSQLTFKRTFLSLSDPANKLAGPPRGVRDAGNRQREWRNREQIA